MSGRNVALQQWKSPSFRAGKTLTNLSPAEKWACAKLTQAKVGSWQRQHIFGARIFDFWHAKKGVAVEIDGPEHNPEYDQIRDAFAFLRSGIIVLRVKNFDASGLDEAINHIKHIGLIKDRRKRMGGNQARKELANRAGLKGHTNWEPAGESSDPKPYRVEWAY